MGDHQQTGAIMIRPTISELENDRSRYECPVPSCNVVLKGLGFFPSHLKKVHNVLITEGVNLKDNNGSKVTLLCFCPMSTCKYGGQQISDRCFTSLKLLRQHFMKVHAEKKYKCEKCGLSFGLDRDRRLHQGRCGQIYQCTDCEAKYTTIEAVQTHCYRKGHTPPERPPKIVEEKINAKPPIESSGHQGTTIGTQTTSMPVILVEVTPQTPVEREVLTKSLSLKPLLPKPSVKLIVPQKIAPILNVPLCPNSQIETAVPEIAPAVERGASQGGPVLCEFVSEGIQASIGDKNLDAGEELPSLLEKSWSSTGIQTAISIKPQQKKQSGTVAQTQTGDMILKKAMACADIPIQMESVGTQMTPQVKGPSWKRRKCTTETQTLSEGASKQKRRRKSLFSEPKTDSVSQTSDPSTCKIDSMCQVDNFRHVSLMDISKSSTTQAAQTDIFLRIDSMSQTKEDGGAQLSKSIANENGQNSKGTSKEGAEMRSNSKSVQFKTRITAPGEGPFSDSDTGPILSVTEQPEQSEERTDSIVASFSKKHDILVPKSSQISHASDTLDLNASSGSKLHDMGIQTFEADFGRFLLSQCENLDRPRQMESQVQTQSSATDMDDLFQMSNRETRSTEMSTDTQTQTVNLDNIETWANNMETQTSIDPDFNSFTFNDIETQTLPDLSLDSAEESSFMNDFSLTSIQTQTMEDDLYQSLSTQTDSFMDMFDFSLTSIHTQTTGQSDHASTQTNQPCVEVNEMGVGSDFSDVIYSSNTETQTADLSLSNTHTQTTWDDLDNLLREFQK